MDFYQESKGGVTLSGGEVLVQPDFAAALLKKCKENGIHTALETTAFSTPLVFSKVLANTDLLLLDIKHYNDREHIKYTGVSNQSILENLDFAVTMKFRLSPGYLSFHLSTIPSRMQRNLSSC